VRRDLVAQLVDPTTLEPLALEADGDGDVEVGVLRSRSGNAYSISNGIPRLLPDVGVDQDQTSRSFGFKWSRRDSYGSPGQRRAYTDWIVARYGFGTVAEIRGFFDGKRTLDAGCGAGWSSSMWLDDSWRGEFVGVDISDAVDVAQETLGHLPDTAFVQADLMALPFPNESFDVVFAEGVLHHTPSTRGALASVARVLRPGGDMLFYVYRRKAPAREFTDDYVREQLSGLSEEDAWEALRPLTELAKALSDLRVDVTVPADVPVLGIAKGTYDVQRLLYWHFAKLFWNDDLAFEENLHLNFDWYRPRFAHRQTEEDVRTWCDEESLAIEHIDVQESGITVRARKGSSVAGR
jgi:arsenite methyltransferase